jgi:hypothetical protein
MSKISEHFRECACGPKPPTTQPTFASWIGVAHQWKALDRLSGGEMFYTATEIHQRTFLLFIAEDLASKVPA